MEGDFSGSKLKVFVEDFFDGALDGNEQVRCISYITVTSLSRLDDSVQGDVEYRSAKVTLWILAEIIILTCDCVSRCSSMAT
jgi:hypothetical protein